MSEAPEVPKATAAAPATTASNEEAPSVLPDGAGKPLEATEGAKEDVKPEAKEEVKPEAKEDVKEEVKPEVKEEPKEEVKVDGKEDVKADVKEDSKEDAKKDVKEASKEDVTKDVKETPKADVKEEVKEPEKAKVAAKVKTPIEALWDLAEAHQHDEIWGVTLKDPSADIPTRVILQKYLNANDGDLTKAKDQLTKTLDWRTEMQPLELVKKQFPHNKFAGVGFVTSHGATESNDPEQKEVFTWNIYGAVKDIEDVFGNLESFIEWRVALMELALQALGIDKATKPITAENDPYKIIQVHDYKSLSFFKQPTSVKSASTETIRVFAQNYPELLKEKFFVNVPAIMGFIYTFMKLFVAQKTIKKFHPMRDGAGLAAEMGSSNVKDLGALLPKEYGGKGPALLEVGKQPSLTEAGSKLE